MKEKINIPKVLMVGPGRDVMGGISTVVNSYYELGLDKEVELFCMILVYKRNFVAKYIIKYGFLITSFLNVLLVAGGTLGFLDYIMINILGESGDLDGRRQIWTLVLARFSKRPLMGYGMGSDIVFNVWQKDNASAHNYFLSILIYGGIIAMMIYLLLIVLFYKKNKP